MKSIRNLTESSSWLHAGIFTGKLVVLLELWKGLYSYFGHVSLTGFLSLGFWILLYAFIGGAGGFLCYLLIGKFSAFSGNRFWKCDYLCALFKFLFGKGNVRCWLQFSVVCAGAVSVFMMQLAAPGTRIMPIQEQSVKDSPSCLLIVLDTLRNDYWGCMGNPTVNTPVIDSFSRISELYPMCVAPSSWTIPSHASLLSGKHSSEIWGIGLDQQERGFSWEQLAVPPGLDFITESLSEKGYATSLISANPLVSNTFGFDQGFQHVTRFRIYPHRKLILYRLVAWQLDLPRNVMEVRKANAVTEMGIDWLSKQDNHPFFLLMNYMDAHAPRLLGKMELLRLENSGINNMTESEQFAVVSSVNSRKTPISADEAQFFTKAYGLISERLDRQVGELLGYLHDQGLIDETAVIVTSDHGEALGEKQFMGHGPSMQEEVIRLPLLVRWPDAHSTGVKNNSVSLINLHSSLCEYLGVPYDDTRVPSLSRSDSPVRSEFLFWGGFAPAGGKRDWLPAICLYDGDTKVILKPGHPGTFYDLGRDPQESDPLSVAGNDLAGGMAEFLMGLVEDDAERAADQPEPIMDDVRREQLKELGYMQ